MLVAAHRLGPAASIPRAWKRFYGRKFVYSNTFARYADQLSQHAFHGRVSAHELVTKHSAWPIFSRLLPDQAAQKWMDDCLIGSRTSTGVRLNSTHRGRMFVAAALRSCTDCIAVDEYHHGTGHWHVVHQLPGAAYCPTHRKPLDDRCTDCGAKISPERLTSLPGEPCVVCGAIQRMRSAVRTPEGSISLSRFYSELMAEKGPLLDPISRQKLHTCAIDSVCGHDSIGQYIANFFDSFECTREEELGDLFEFEISARAIRAGLQGGTNSCPPALHLALAEFSLKLLGDAWGETQQQFQVSSSAHGGDTSQSTRNHNSEATDRVLEAARASGFSTEAIMRRISGASHLEIAKEGLATHAGWRQFMNDLSPDLREHVAQMCATSNRQPRSIPSFDDSRRVHRNRILAVLKKWSGGRQECNRHCRKSMIWCGKHDRAWLDETVPPRSHGRASLAFRSTREAHRTFIDQSIARVGLSASLRGSAAFKWCSRHDKQWLAAALGTHYRQTFEANAMKDAAPPRTRRGGWSAETPHTVVREA